MRRIVVTQVLLLVLGVLPVAGQRTPIAPTAPATITVDIVPMPNLTGYTQRTVCASGCDFSLSQFQAALDFAEANCGANGVILTITAGQTVDTASGFVLQSTDCAAGKWVIIRTSAHASLPSAPTSLTKGTGWGVRLAPGDFANLATIRSTATNVVPLLIKASNASTLARVRLVGLDFTSTASTGSMLELGDGNAGGSQDTASEIPTQVVVDRCRLRGASNTANTVRGIAMFCNDCLVIGSYIEKIHTSGQQTQGIVTWNSNGPMAIINNHISAAGMNIFFASETTAVPNALPSDLSVLGNYLLKDPCWNPSDACFYGGGYNYNVVNTVESKMSKRVLLRGNALENVWPQVQSGSFFTLKSENQSGPNTQAETSSWLVQFNLARNGQNFIDVGAKVGSFSAVPGSKYQFSDNLFYEMRTNLNGTATLRWAVIGGCSTAQGFSDLGVFHNTLVPKASETRPGGWKFIDIDCDIGATSDNPLPNAGFHSNLMAASPTTTGGNINQSCVVRLNNEGAWSCFDVPGNTANGEESWFDNIIWPGSEDTQNGGNCAANRWQSSYRPYALNKAAACPADTAAVRFVNTATHDYDLCTGVDLPVVGCVGASPAVGAGIAHDGANYIGAKTGRPGSGTANTVYGETCGAISGNWLCYGAAAPAPTVTNATPNNGSENGGTSVTLTGTAFVAGARATFGGTQATNVVVVSSTSITCTTPAHAAGAANVVVTNPDSQSGTCSACFTYNASTAPTISAISPNSGTTFGGTPVTVTGTNFVSGATVAIGGLMASNETFVNSTTLTATTPARSAATVNVVVTNPDAQAATLTNGYTFVVTSPVVPPGIPIPVVYLQGAPPMIQISNPDPVNHPFCASSTANDCIFEARLYANSALVLAVPASLFAAGTASIPMPGVPRYGDVIYTARFAARSPSGVVIESSDSVPAPVRKKPIEPTIIIKT